MQYQKFPFKKQRIREALAPLNIDAPVPDSLPVKRYRKFYGIDFENQLPDVTSALGIIKSTGFDIVTHVFHHLEAKGTVFVFHGLYDHVGIFDKPIHYFLSKGYSVVAYDLPGHGVSSGQLAAVKHFYRYRQVLDTVVQTIQDKMPHPWCAIAQSTGGAVLIDEMLNKTEPYPFQKTVLLAPLIRPKNWQRNKYIHTLVSRFFDYIPRKFTVNSHDDGFLAFLRDEDILQSRYLSAHWVGALKEWIPAIEKAQPSEYPLMVIQGQEDETVDWEYNIPVLQEKFPNMELLYLPTLRHQVVNEIESLRQQVFKAAFDYLAQPLPTPKP